MGTVVLDNAAGYGKGTRTTTLVAVNDETERLHLSRGESCLIHCSGVTGGSTVQVLVYANTNSTGIAAANALGTVSHTTDFAFGFTAPGKCSVTAKLTVDGGTVVCNITK